MYHGLFHEFSPIYGKETITQADVETAEQRLGFRLPPDYIQLLQYQNGGILQQSVYGVAVVNGKSKPVGGVFVIFGIGGEDGIDALADGKTHNQTLIENWGYPAWSVVFAPQGSAGFAFDYDALDADGEPSILYRYCDCDVPVTYRRVFRNFRHLLDSLEPLPDASDLSNEPRNQL